MYCSTSWRRRQLRTREKVQHCATCRAQLGLDRSTLLAVHCCCNSVATVQPCPLYVFHSCVINHYLTGLAGIAHVPGAAPLTTPCALVPAGWLTGHVL